MTHLAGHVRIVATTDEALDFLGAVSEAAIDRLATTLLARDLDVDAIDALLAIERERLRTWRDEMRQTIRTMFETARVQGRSVDVADASRWLM